MASGKLMIYPSAFHFFSFIFCWNPGCTKHPTDRTHSQRAKNQKFAIMK